MTPFLSDPLNPAGSLAPRRILPFLLAPPALVAHGSCPPRNQKRQSQESKRGNNQSEQPEAYVDRSVQCQPRSDALIVSSKLGRDIPPAL
jgi:hypothetical protein